MGAVLLCVPAAAQESPPSPDPVAQVGAVAISKADYEHWFAQAVHSHFGRPMELVGPRYDRCVAAKRRKRVTEKWRWLGERELRERCVRDHRALHGQVVQFLVQAQWVEQEAARRGVRVGERRVDRMFERQRRLAFPEEGGYEIAECGASAPPS